MRYLTLIAVFCLIWQFSKAQAKPDPVIAAQIDQEVWDPFKVAYATNDGPLYVNLHTDDVLRITSWGIQQGLDWKQKTLKRFAKPNRLSSTIDFRFEHRIHSDSISYEVGYYKLVRKKQGEKEAHYGRFHVVLKKINGHWKIAQDWDTGNVNGHEVGAHDYNRLDSIQAELRTTFSLQNINPTVLQQEGSKLFQYWDIKNDPTLWSGDIGTVPALQAFKDTLLNALGEALLLGVISKEGTQYSIPNNSIPEDTLNNYDLVYKGYLGNIRKINFIEAEVLNYQLNRFPLFSHPTEFHCFIAQHDSLDLVRIYFGASDEPFPPKPNVIISHLDEAVQNGWQLTKHLHNHYNQKETNYLGVAAPSKADAHYFKMLKENYNIPEALITNGYHTVVLKATEFEKFNSH